MWFEELTGFVEESPEQVRSNLTVEGHVLKSRVNCRKYICGELETPSLGELRERVKSAKPQAGRLAVREVVADVQRLHVDNRNAGALFQVASQFNLLEMVSPEVTPESGVDRYEYDRTQGPACAVAAGAGTIYRNYFVDVNGQTGQSADNQIDCLAELGDALGNTCGRLWQMRNGYALPSKEGLQNISGQLERASEEELDELRQLLWIGLHRNVQVTLDGAGHTVSQAYCSALPVAYGGLPVELWSGLARLILEASYEATLCAAVLNASSTGNKNLFLTMLGGGVFGNRTEWIIEAMRRALDLFKNRELDVAIVSYGHSSPAVAELLTD